MSSTSSTSSNHSPVLDSDKAAERMSDNRSSDKEQDTYETTGMNSTNEDVDEMKSFTNDGDSRVSSVIDTKFVSPYEEKENLESKELCFEELKAIMTPISNGEEKVMNPEMDFLFGDKLARDVYSSHQKIVGLGVSFDKRWWLDCKIEGSIQEAGSGWIPKRQRLLCLVDDRFANASEKTLRQITKQLNCSKIVDEAIFEWNLQEKYINLSAFNSSTFIYAKEPRRCYKCEIFVARAYAALQILRKVDLIDEKLLGKIKTSLKIMNENVQVSVNRLVEWRKERKAEKKKKTMEEFSATDLGQNKRPFPEIAVDVNNGAEAASETSGVSADFHGYRCNHRPNQVQRRVGTPEERERTLLVLYNIVKEQHDKLGQTIALLQDSLQEHRSLLREEYKAEIRAEILQEMQESEETSDAASSGNSRRKRRRSLKS